MQKYWFYIDSFVHIELKNNAALFYNSLTKSFFIPQTNKTVYNIIREIINDDNHRVIQFTEKEIANEDISAFINNIKSHFMGDLIPCELSNIKPVQMNPIVEVNNGIKKDKRLDYKTIGENQMEYLHELNIQITGTCNLSCKNCKTAYKQFLSCTKNNFEDLPIETLDSILKDVENLNCQINILGGNMFLYQNIEKLISYLTKYKQKINLYHHYLNYTQNKHDNLFELTKDFHQIFIIDELILENIEILFQKINQFKVNYEIIFVVESENDLNGVSELIEKYNIVSYSIKPLYNTKNNDFFEEFIYSTRDIIHENAPDLKTIYTNSVLNSNNFGTIFVNNNGKIFSNINEEAIGDIYSDTIHDAIFKELSKSESWFKIRQDIEPCNECIYVNMCPPIGNYEKIINKNNLCHIDIAKHNLSHVWNEN